MWTTKKQWGRFFSDLTTEITDDHVDQGAAALGYYLTFSIFPALIALLSVIPYLPIDNLAENIMGFLGTVVPAQAADMVRNVVNEVTSNRRGGLLSFGLIAAIWSASRGMSAVFQQMNIAYNQTESRSFVKFNAQAVLVTLFFGFIIVVTFTAMATEGVLRDYLVSQVGFESFFVLLFNIGKWALIGLLGLTGFAVIYYYGPDEEVPFKWVTPGSVFGVLASALTAFLFSTSLSSFLDFSATYGSIGAVILLMLWFYIIGWILLLGAEINSIVEAYKSDEVTPKEEKLREARHAHS